MQLTERVSILFEYQKKLITCYAKDLIKRRSFTALQLFVVAALVFYLQINQLEFIQPLSLWFLDHQVLNIVCLNQ